jgi:hypothetical protein
VFERVVPLYLTPFMRLRALVAAWGVFFCPWQRRADAHGVVLAFVGMPMTSVLASLVRPKKIGSSGA